jgi:hypothetical protein
MELHCAEEVDCPKLFAQTLFNVELSFMMKQSVLELIAYDPTPPVQS